MSTDLLTYRTRDSDGDPAGALVLIHGRGASEHDLEPLADALDPERRLDVVLPRGPLTIPPGGFHWYVVQRVGFPHAPTFLPAFERLSTWLDAVLSDRGLPIEKTVIGGFSQGCVMSHALAFAAARPRPAGMIGFSGFVPRVEGFDLDLEGRSGLPVFLAHGTYDGVITVDFGRDARDRLEAAGVDVTYREDPVDHTIAMGALDDARRALELMVS
ncbi:MAG: phospholipase [Actinobacteria bacterium]|nr:phospholipase [Actinomycetota bacterium]